MPLGHSGWQTTQLPIFHQKRPQQVQEIAPLSKMFDVASTHRFAKS